MSEFGETYGEWAYHHDGTPVVVSVERYKGQGAAGPVFEAPVEIPEGEAIAMPQSRLVRSTDGNQIMSTTAVYAEPEHVDLLALHSRVTVDGKTSGTVATVTHPDVAGLFDFVTVNLE